MRIVIGMTGASGAIYGVGLLSVLHGRGGHELHVTATENGLAVLAHECGWGADDLARYGHFHPPGDMFAPIASGSFPVDGMVIAPCSANTLGKIAGGIGDTLVTRAASIALKEQRKLLLLVRETPFNAIHLDNMAALARAGAVIAPPVPGFYSHPRGIADLVAQAVGRALDLLGVEASIAPRWGISIGPAPDARAHTDGIVSDLLARL